MTSAPNPYQHQPGSLRVSDADRDLVTQVLNTAYAEGRITHDELDERMDLVLTSKTFDDLRPITADLMPTRSTQQYATTPQEPSNRVAINPAGHESDVITAVMSSRNRTTGWRLARRSTVSAVMGDVKLDLRGGSMEAHDCEINLNVIMGEVKLFVPEGVIVVDRTTSVLADTGMKGLRPAAVGAPTITLTGFCFMGDVKVYGPDHRSLGKRLGLTSS